MYTNLLSDNFTIRFYDWEFGDGNTGIGLTPTHTYTSGGAYTVTLTVVDDEGAVSTPATTTVAVSTQEEAIGDIQEDVQTLADEGILNPGQANSLSSKLRNAIESVEHGHIASACGQLQAFINEVNAKTPTPLDATTAATLLVQAETIRRVSSLCAQHGRTPGGASPPVSWPQRTKRSATAQG